MTKSKSKFKGIFKGAAIGFAFVLCGAFFPFNAAAALAESWQGSDATDNTQRIEIGQESGDQTFSSTVTKGDRYTIPQGVYHSNGTEHIIGTLVADSGVTSSKVEVLYQATNDMVGEVISGIDSFEGQSFLADRIGTYTIRYTVVDNGVEYSYDYEVVCVASDAEFEFRANNKNIVPTIYDKELAKDKNIVIPLPTVNDEDGDPLLSSEDYIEDEDSNYYTNDMENRPTYTPDGKNAFVYISLTGGSENTETNEPNVKLEKDQDGNFYINGASLKNELAGTEFKITYSYYEIRQNSTPVFINSTSTTFTVQDEYYFTTSEKSEHGYELNTSWSTTRPTSAVVGNSVDLPSVTATTKSTNSPASESVNVYFELQVMKYNEDTGRYDKNVTTDTYDRIKNTFTAKEEGSYRFIYTVRDFYNNEVDSSSTSFYINNVRDTQQANVYVYDAGDYTVEDGVYSDASHKIKTEGLNRNIIVYAIAGKDNMVEADAIDLRREIRDATRVVFNITEKMYNSYNLIFAPTTTNSEDNTVIDYAQIALDNFDIYRQMLIDEGDYDPSDAESVKAWLLENDYLIVTTYWNQDPTGAQILGKDEPGYSTEVGNEEAIAAMRDKGFAYIEAETTNGHYDEFSSSSYTFYYYADDNNTNNIPERAAYYQTRLSDAVSDSTAPTITFSTDLKTTYLPTDTITFDVATATDNIDSRLNVVTAYRFVDESGEPITDSNATNKLQFIVSAAGNNVHTNYDENSDKWFIKNADENGLVTSEGWYLEDSEYSINLASVPEDAYGIEIFAYAVDDVGNIAFYDRTVSIAKAYDNDIPGLIRVENAPDDMQLYTAPQTISLPTLEFTDSRVDYMYANVEVYKIELSEEGNITSKQFIQNRNMTSSVDTYRGIFRVNAGTFNASTSGTYQAVVTVVDASNHSVATYFTYNVEDSGVVEDPQITNISSTPIEAAAGDEYTLDPPVLSVSESTSFGYIGINTDDDSNTSTYYTTSIIESYGDYDLTLYGFTGYDKGTYKLQYTVYLMRYRLSRLLEDGINSADAGIYLDENGRLKYKETGASSTSYFIYFQATDNGYIPTMNTDFHGLGNTPTVQEGQTLEEVVEGLLDGLVDMFAIPSNVQTITVGDIGLNIIFDGNPYEQTQYPTIDEDNIKTVTIVKPDIREEGNVEVNDAESYVQITCTSGTERNVGTIYFDKWEESIDNASNDFTVQGSEIKLRLVRNGEYTITYNVVGMDSNGDNIGQPRTAEFTISNGDVQDPVVDIDETKYSSTIKLGDPIIIDIDSIEFSDNVTSTDELLESIEVTIRNTDNNSGSQDIPNTAEEGGYEFEYTPTEVGNYTVTITVTDKAGRTGSDSFSFEVTTDGGDTINVQQVLGGVLIGISVVVLAGVVIYFVVSKVKLDKRAKGYERELKNDKNKK